MLFKLALKNIRKSIKDYSIYFFTLVIAVSIFYIFNSIGAQNSMLLISDYKHEMVESLVEILSYISVFVSLILGFLIIYSNNFIIKRRKKEIGLYLTLGMSKRKVSTILVIETVLVGIISLIVGLLIGIFLSQFLSIVTAKMFEADMSNFKFVFSSSSLFKTIIYFGIIFILVMIFNVISLGKYKLIDLLTAKRKNESSKLRNKYITIISFLLSIILMVYAYKLLFSGVLLMMDKETLIMIICGAVATLLFFFSLSGFLLFVIQKIKKLYYKDLNIFVLKQINSKINSSVISTTIISLLLLLTIGILSGSISLASAFNTNIKNTNLVDFTLYSNYGIYQDVGMLNETVNIDGITSDDEFNNYVKEFVKYSMYNVETLTIKDLISEDSLDELYKQFGSAVEIDGNVNIIKESDYVSLMKLFGKDKDIIDIEDDEYLELCNVDMVIDYYSKALKDGNKIDINGNKLIPASKEVYNTAIDNYSGAGNDGIVVVSDYLLENNDVSEERLLGNYITSDDEKLEKDFINYLTNNDVSEILVRTKLQMEATSISIKVIITFVGLYLGIIFAITSVTVLAIGQLSSSSDNRERYNIIKRIGADNKLVNRSLFTQIAITFLLPLFVALIHSYFGLREINRILKVIGNIDISTSIIITTGVLLVIYGGYLLATYLCSKNIIKN